MRGTSLLPFFWVLALPVTGCVLVTPGERMRADGGCPAGETCSTATPNGLLFTGASLSWTPPDVHLLWPVTTGGTETVGLLEASDGGVPFARPFVAASDAPSVLTVGAPSGASVPVQGQAAGSARLRVLEPDGVALYDRVGVRVAAPTEVVVIGRQLDIPTSEVAPDGGVGTPHVALLGGGHATVVVTPLGADASWLVDERASITTGAVVSSQRAFDLVDVTVPATGAVTFDARYGATTLHETLQVVTHVTSIVAPSRTMLHVGESAMLCASARAGGQVLLGDGWGFSSPSAAFTLHPSADARGPMPGCVDVSGVAAGTGTVAVTFGDATLSFDVTVTVPGATAAPLVALDAPTWTGATRGERAGGE